MLKNRFAIVTTSLALASVFALVRASVDRDAWLLRASGEASVREGLELRIAALEEARAEEGRAALQRTARLQSDLELARGEAAQAEAVRQDVAALEQALAAAEARLAGAGEEVLVRDAATGMILTIREPKGSKRAVELLAALEGPVRAPGSSSRVQGWNGRWGTTEEPAPLNQGVAYVDAVEAGEKEVDAIVVSFRTVVHDGARLNQGVDYVEPEVEGGLVKENRPIQERVNRRIRMGDGVEVVPPAPTDHP